MFASVLDHTEVIPEAVYHEATRKGLYLSSHMLATYRRCPLLYYKRLKGLAPEKQSTAYALGSAAHKLILEGSAAFDREYIISSGPINPKTGAPYGAATKAYQAWADEQARAVIAPDEYAIISEMRDRVIAHPFAAELLRDGVPERVIRTTVQGMPCQVRLDWFNQSKGLVDLKTCADLDAFEKDARKFGYVHQLAFYREVIRAASGVTVPVYLIAVEKQEPFRAGVWQIDETALNAAAATNRRFIDALKASNASDNWPTGFEDVRVLGTDLY
jgi:uncharacterized protein YciI